MPATPSAVVAVAAVGAVGAAALAAAEEEEAEAASVAIWMAQNRHAQNVSEVTVGAVTALVSAKHLLRLLVRLARNICMKFLKAIIVLPEHPPWQREKRPGHLARVSSKKASGRADGASEKAPRKMVLALIYAQALAER
jgi:hypothetical protein